VNLPLPQLADKEIKVAVPLEIADPGKRVVVTQTRAVRGRV
jgi:hypothetical protein